MSPPLLMAVLMWWCVSARARDRLCVLMVSSEVLALMAPSELKRPKTGAVTVGRMINWRRRIMGTLTHRAAGLFAPGLAYHSRELAVPRLQSTHAAGRCESCPDAVGSRVQPGVP